MGGSSRYLPRDVGAAGRAAGSDEFCGGCCAICYRSILSVPESYTTSPDALKSKVGFLFSGDFSSNPQEGGQGQFYELVRLFFFFLSFLIGFASPDGVQFCGVISEL